VTKFRIGL